MGMSLPVRIMTDADERFGRIRIYTDEEVITAANVLDVLSKSMVIHNLNQTRIEYLWQYYRGNQPILEKTKAVREEINHKVVVNIASEVVDFKTGYLLGEPMQYVSDVDEADEKLSEEINRLNDWMKAEDKQTSDSDVCRWFHVCGQSYRMALPSKEADAESPFHVYAPDPRFTFIVYWSGLGHKPVMGVQMRILEDGTELYSCYTPDRLLEVRDGKVVADIPHTIGEIPIVEYPLNIARQGAFERVMSLCDAYNSAESDSLDGLEQFVQSFFKFINCDIDEKKFDDFRRKGMIKIKSVDGTNADVDLITAELNQTQTQVLKDNIYQQILNICGMPNRNGGSSTSDTGAAVTMRDGWSAAETMAKDTETIFKRSERQFIRVVLNICRAVGKTTLMPSQVEQCFTRRNYSDLLSKSQVLTTMLDNPKIHPLLAFQSCGMFIDPEAAYARSNEYYEEQMEKLKEQQIVNVNEEEDDEGRASRNPEDRVGSGGQAAGKAEEDGNS